jgi:TIR domain
MREFLFYLSYAHRDFDPSLEKFFDDLRREVELLTGEAAIGFMDRQSIRLEHDWAEETANALRNSRVLVALYSPAYFRSEFCGKEWTAFLSGRRDSSEPSGILPVLWSPLEMIRDMPDVAARIQFIDPSYPEVYAKQGLRYLLRLQKHADEYAELLTQFARSVVRVAESAPKRPGDRVAPPSQVESAFGRRAVQPDRDRKPQTVSGDDSFAKKLLAFLCHASGDKPRVRNLYSKLAASGVDAWLDEKNLLPGQDWSSVITRTVRESDVVIVCFSRASVTKAGYVQKEMRLALDVADEQPEGAMFLIPVRLEECDVPERFRHLHYADLFEADGYAKLLNSLQFRASEVGAAKPSDE